MGTAPLPGPLPSHSANSTAIDPACPDAEVLRRFLEGDLPPQRLHAIAAHLAQCAACRQVLEGASGEGALRALQRSHWREEATESIIVPSNLTDHVLDAMASQHVGSSASEEERGEDELASVVMPASLGRFQIRESLGEGGFGVVYRADDPQLNRSVALKVPRMGVLLDPAIRERFVREARAAARLHHPHIVTLYEAGICEGTFYLASAFLQGPTLAEWLRVRGCPASPVEAAQLVLALAYAVEHAHSLGILHRDIKPQNVLLDETLPFRGLPFSPKLTDFGLAMMFEAAHEAVDAATATGSVVGTPRYMAPEQASGLRESMGPASDIYSLGVILYELLTGVAPIDGEGHADTLRRVVSEEPQPVRSRVPGVPRDLEAICMKCLEKTPARRFATARALADDLDRFLTGQPTRTRPLAPAERWLRWIRRRPAQAGLLGVTITALTAILGGLFLYSIRLRDFNESLARANTQLQSALREAEQAKQHAEQSDAQTQDLLYAADMHLAARARKEGDARLLTSLLSRQIPRDRAVDRRGLEWRFLWQSMDTSRQVLIQGSAEIYHLALAPDGRRLAAVGKEAVVRILDLASGEVVAQWATGQVEVNGAAFSPDGDQIATAGDDGTVRLWSVRGEGPSRVIAAHQPQAFHVVFLSAETLASCGTDTQVRLWEVATGKEVQTLPGSDSAVESLALSPDGSRLAMAGRDGIIRVESPFGDPHPLRLDSSEDSSAVYSLAFSPDGRLLIAGNGRGKVQVWNLTTAARVAQSEHLDSIQFVSISPDGRSVLSGDRAGALCLWELSDPATSEHALTVVRRWSGHEGRAFTGLFVADHGLITGGGDGRVCQWKLSRAEEIEALGRLPRIHDVAVDASGHLVAWLRDRSLIRAAVPLAEHAPQQIGVDYVGRHFALSRDGRRMLVTPSSDLLELWDVMSHSVLRQWRFGGPEILRGVGLSADGQRTALWTLDTSSVLEVFDNETGQRLGRLEPAIEELPHLAFAPDGEQLAFCLDNDLCLWEIGSRDFRRIRQAHDNTIEDLTYSPRGNLLATASSDRSVKLWNPRTGTLHASLSRHRNSVVSVVFDHDGRSLVTASHDGTIKVWNVAVGEELLEIAEDPAGFKGVRLSPDGRRLVGLTRDFRLVIRELALGENPTD